MEADGKCFSIRGVSAGVIKSEELPAIKSEGRWQRSVSESGLAARFGRSFRMREKLQLQRQEPFSE